ncbi:cornifelin homolog A-like [Gigantopelta aegis]|uniref:cornifelin homolog A-like n=1 Tax=Gigantopelta aegis TaxID=1735272 RepID=UPI001B88E6D9|nr:cornifelin homolog A-like [Gigantopelta aegis]
MAQVQPAPEPDQPTQQQQTTVIVNQPINQPMHMNPMQPHPLREWSTGLCGCCEDVGDCFFALCCPTYYTCMLSGKQGDSCWGPCCVPAWTTVFRSHIRGVHSIKGSICNDCMVTNCCGPCAMCQMGRELTNILKGDPRALPLS